MEDPLGALGLALNAVVLFESLCIDAAVKQLAADGFPVTAELLARLSPLQYDHIKLPRPYAFTSPPGTRSAPSTRSSAGRRGRRRITAERRPQPKAIRKKRHRLPEPLRRGGPA